MINVVPISGTSIPTATEPTQQQNAAFQALSEALSCRYVRREHRFYNVNRPGEPMSRRDMEQAFLNQAQALTPNTPNTAELMKRVFTHCIDVKHTDKTKSIPVWGGELAAHPGNPNRIIWLDTGSVGLNTWSLPS